MDSLLSYSCRIPNVNHVLWFSGNPSCFLYFVQITLWSYWFCFRCLLFCFINARKRRPLVPTLALETRLDFSSTTSAHYISSPYDILSTSRLSAWAWTMDCFTLWVNNGKILPKKLLIIGDYGGSEFTPRRSLGWKGMDLINGKVLRNSFLVAKYDAWRVMSAL